MENQSNEKRDLLRIFKAAGILTLVTLIILVIVAWFSPTKESKNTASSIDEKKIVETSTPIPTPSPKPITYLIVKRWSIPNGGEGKVILISLDYFNESDMPLVGQKLNEDTKGDRNAFIFVFTDMKAAQMRDKVLSDELSDEDREYYDSHYVGQYSKNSNTGFHQFVIYYDGIMGSNSQTIKY